MARLSQRTINNKNNERERVDTISYYAIIVGLTGSLAIIIGISWWYIHHLIKENNRHKQYTEGQKSLQREMHLKARQKFEKVVAENATVIEKDVRTTAASLSGRMEKELTQTVGDELEQYKVVSRQVATAMQDTLKNLQETADTEQRKFLTELRMGQEKMSQDLTLQHQQVAERIEKLVDTEVNRRIKRFEESMASIIQSYVTTAVNNQLDVDSEFEYIMKELEANKLALREDIGNGGV